MSSQTVHCPNCSALIPAADINITALVAKCAGCNHIFPLPDLSPVASDGSVAEPPPSRPSGIVHEEGPAGELYIRRSWFHASLFFLLFFCIAWDGFLIFWYSMALFGPVQGQGGIDGWIMILFPIGHVAVGVGLTYYVIAGFLNTTRILVDANSLHVRHQPIPWRGNRSLPVMDIQGFELDTTYTSNNGPALSVSAHHADGRQVVLLSGLNPRQAKYVAYHLSKHLNVPLSQNDTATTRGRLPAWLGGWGTGGD